MICDNFTKPLVYSVTKREDTFPLGVYKIVLAQDHYNPQQDNAELGICDYYTKYNNKDNDRVEDDSKNLNAMLKCNGLNKVLSIGGSPRTITAITVDEEDKETPYENPVWSFVFRGEDKTMEQLSDYFSIDAEENTLSISAKDDYTIANSILIISVGTSETDGYAQIEIEVRR